MNITQLNHVAIHVRDLERSVDFYRLVLGLAPMERPAFEFPGAWFRLGLDQELHLICRSGDDEVAAPPRERHYALAVDDIEAAAADLRRAGVDFQPPKRRPDGAIQIFLRDPDGHVIELCQLHRRKRGQAPCS